MAIVKLIGGRDEVIAPEVGATVWQVLNSEIEPTDEQREYAQRVEKVFLNWRSAPDSYIETHKETIFKMVVGEWMIAGEKGPDGKIRIIQPRQLTGSEFSNTANREFSKKWGLLDHGHPTALARKYI